MTRLSSLPARGQNVLLTVSIAAALLLSLAALQYLSDPIQFLYFNLGFVGLASAPILAIYYLFNRSLDQRFPLRETAIVVASLIIVANLLTLTDSRLLIDVLGIIQRRFIHQSWQALGLILAALVFLPLIGQSLRRRVSRNSRTDMIAICAFFLMTLLLYLPFGFNSVGHWEAWNYFAHLQGQHSINVDYEVATRFWVMVPHALATIISAESFLGFHIVHLLIIWGKMVFLYGILRQIKVPPFYAFLIGALLLLYPVNSAMISIRSLPNQFSMMTLLAAVYFILDYRYQSSRFHLLAIWLALAFNVASNETAYALILVIPILWLRDGPWLTARKIKLTAIWYLSPVAKLAYLLLLAGTGQRFYGGNVFEKRPDAGGFDLGIFSNISEHLAQVYQHTFLESWQNSMSALSENSFPLLTLLIILLVGGVAIYLSRSLEDSPAFSARQASIVMLAGLLLIVPSVGVLVLIDQYSGDLWRMYFYVPVGAAVAVFGVMFFITALLKPQPVRNSILIGLCLLLLVPSFARLMLQHQTSVTSADNKAILLGNLLKIAPRLDPDTYVVLTTDLTIEQMDATDFYEFNYSYDLDDSMLYLLYGSGSPVHSSFCNVNGKCSSYGGEETLFTSETPDELLQRTLVFKLNADLSVELIEDPAAYFDLEINVPYDASLLYDANAPLPPRAYTMLGAERP